MNPTHNTIVMSYVRKWLTASIMKKKSEEKKQFTYKSCFHPFWQWFFFSINIFSLHGNNSLILKFHIVELHIVALHELAIVQLIVRPAYFNCFSLLWVFVMNTIMTLKE